MSSGTDKIVSSIMSEAQGKADVIIQDANAEVSAIQAKAEKTAEVEAAKIKDNGKKQSDMRYQQIISEAKMNARRAELGAKEEVIEAAFDKATDDLKDIASFSAGTEETDPGGCSQCAFGRVSAAVYHYRCNRSGDQRAAGSYMRSSALYCPKQAGTDLLRRLSEVV